MSNYINSSEGTFFIEMKASADDLTFRYISISDGTNNNVIRLYYTIASNSITYQVKSNASLQVFNQVLVSDITNYNRIAIKWKLNDFSMFINGLEVATDTNGNTPINLNSFQFIDGDLTSNPFYGKVKDLRIYKTALTDQELTDLTIIKL